MAAGKKLVKTAEGVAWSMVGLAALLVLTFYVIHLLSQAPVIGGTVNAVGARASGSNYGY
jgi:hypothetical protein